MKKIYLLWIALAILFSGCAKESALLIPKYNESNKTLTIDDMTFDKVTYFTSRKSRPGDDLKFANTISWEYQKITLDNAICKKFKNRVSFSNGFSNYAYSALQDIQEYYKGHCNGDKIPNTNIYALECIDSIHRNNKNTYRRVYGFSQSSKKGNGYGTKVLIGVYDSKECWNYIKKNIEEKYADKK